MNKIDCTASAADIATAVASQLPSDWDGAVALVMPCDNEMGHVYLDDQEVLGVGDEDELFTASGTPLKIAASLAMQIAEKFPSV